MQPTLKKILKFFIPRSVRDILQWYPSRMRDWRKVLWFHFTQYLRLLLKGKFKNARNYFWTIIFSKEDGMGLNDIWYMKFPKLTPYPMRIELEPTTKCCLRCPKCEHTYWDYPDQDMTFEQFLHIVKQFPKLRCVSMTGIGHGFHNPDYLKMLKWLKDHHIYTQFYDPFFIIHDDLSKQLVEMGIDKIIVSIDGASKELYEKSQVGAKYETVIQNIKNILKWKRYYHTTFPEIIYKMVVTSENYTDMPKLIDLVEEFSKEDTVKIKEVEYVKMLPFQDNQHLQPVPMIDPETVKATVDKAKKYGKFRVLTYNIPFRKCQPLNKCSAWTVPFILVDGSVYPCCALTEGNRRRKIQPYVPGNVLKEDFHTLWQTGGKYRQIIEQTNAGIAPKICMVDPETCKFVATKRY